MMTSRTLISTVFLPLLLLALAGVQLAIGGNALPIWIASILQANEQDPQQWLRAMVIIECALALVFIFHGRRIPGLTLIVIVVIAFISLAECSAAIRRQMLGSIFVSAFVFAATLLMANGLLKSRTRAAEEEAPPLPPIRGITVLGTALLAAVVTAILLQIPIAPRTLAEGAISRESLEQEQSQPTRAIELIPESWIGRPLADTEIGRFVPDVVELLKSGPGTLVLYNPRCGSCHDLFNVHFSSGVDRTTVAVLIPPSPQERVIESEYPDEVVCEGCEFASLPTGPLWLVQPPIVLGIEDGVVQCIATDDPTPCLGES